LNGRCQRAQAIKRRKQIWEALHPTRQRFDSVYEALGMDGEPGGQSFPTRNDDGTFIKGGPKEKAFAASTAAVSGESKRAINQHLARAEALGDDLERITGKVESDYTEAARVEIGRALEVELQGRVGVNQHTGDGMENFPHPPKGTTRDLAAKAAGFGNGTPARVEGTTVSTGNVAA